MIYLESFSLASSESEVDFILGNNHKLMMTCYDGDNVYPFKLFPEKGLRRLNFEPITIFHGSNGSGKSTLLNIIAEKLNIRRTVSFNTTPFMEEYLRLCSYSCSRGAESVPKNSEIISSDGVFDYLLDIRAINGGAERRREDLFFEYDDVKRDHRDNGPTLDDYDELKRRNEIRRRTKSDYTARRMSSELPGRSNGENAIGYFSHRIKENALYLLDEPENSLSAKMQTELLKLLQNSARFYGCQFIISTHSPFLLSLKGAKIYDLDTVPVSVTKWTELENVKTYYAFFKEKEDQFADSNF